MFSLFRRRRDRECAATQNSEEAQRTAIRLLALTRDADEWQSLHDIAERQGWIMFWAHTSERARELVERYSIPIVICDRALPAEDWRKVIRKLAQMAPPVCVLLASEVADDYLWREVVQNQGFEVLTKPFEAEKLVRTIRFASSWRVWAHKRPAQA